MVINSFSKYHCMTGWRIGWNVVPQDLLSAFNIIQQNAYINAPTVAQVAALAAMDCVAELDGNVDTYRCNRTLLLEGPAQPPLHPHVFPQNSFPPTSILI